MKTTNSNIAVKVENEDGFTTFVFGFQLHNEDVEIVTKTIMPTMDKETGKEHDLADVLLACLTYGIHKSYEDIEGVPFTLRMDRKKRKA